MVFVGGPRQVGKTTLSFHLLGKDSDERSPAYFNWDEVGARRQLTEGLLPAGVPLIVLDEIHKYKRWRNLVKGFYDRYKKDHQFLVTGSARLDFYRRGGDSLQGRYHYYRLHPFSVSELGINQPHDLAGLLRFGGFPEPFLKMSPRHWRRWQKERQSRLFREDLLSLEQVREVGQLDILSDILRERVGSLLSVNSLREDLSLAFETIERYLSIFENLYYCFRIMPFGSPKIRALKKEKKLYFWDWSLCQNQGPRFENLVASHLLKYCHFVEDFEGDTMELRYLRDVQGHEVDFVVLRNKTPEFAVECKTGDKGLSQGVKYFASRTPIPEFFQVHLRERDVVQKEYRVRILPFTKFCQLKSIP
jgi:uncharacterized protein